MVEHDPRSLFDRAIQDLIRGAIGLLRSDPLMAGALLRILRYQQAAARRREASWAQGIPAPAMAIVSVTQRCNLQCAGCYAQALHREPEPELTTAELGRTLKEASDLGMAIALLAGGEPLLRPDLLDLTAERAEMLFAVFTNGTLLDDAAIARLATQRHVIPVLSLEGHQADTDARRGNGMHVHSLRTMERLKSRRLFFGISLTLTSQNYDTVSDPAYLEALISSGCRLFFFVEYVPAVTGTEFLTLTEAQRQALPGLLEGLQARLPGLFVTLPGDEALYGGCLAAGRGFVHINPQGRLEPCPFAPWSDTSLREMPLAEALRSPFLQALRESDLHLAESSGGCTLWAHRDQVTALLQGRMARPPDHLVVDARAGNAG